MVEPEVDENRLVLTNHGIKTRVAKFEAMDPAHLRGYSKYKAFYVSVAGSWGDRNLLGCFGSCRT